MKKIFVVLILGVLLISFFSINKTNSEAAEQQCSYGSMGHDSLFADFGHMWLNIKMLFGYEPKMKDVKDSKQGNWFGCSVKVNPEEQIFFKK